MKACFTNAHASDPDLVKPKVQPQSIVPCENKQCHMIFKEILLS